MRNIKTINVDDSFLYFFMKIMLKLFNYGLLTIDLRASVKLSH